MDGGVTFFFFFKAVFSFVFFVSKGLHKRNFWVIQHTNILQRFAFKSFLWCFVFGPFSRFEREIFLFLEEILGIIFTGSTGDRKSKVNARTNGVP